jgi:hypothetical protein
VRGQYNNQDGLAKKQQQRILSPRQKKLWIDQIFVVVFLENINTCSQMIFRQYGSSSGHRSSSSQVPVLGLIVDDGASIAVAAAAAVCARALRARRVPNCRADKMDIHIYIIAQTRDNEGQA